MIMFGGLPQWSSHVNDLLVNLSMGMRRSPSDEVSQRASRDQPPLLDVEDGATSSVKG